MQVFDLVQRAGVAALPRSRSSEPLGIDTLHIGPPVLPVLEGGGGAVERRMLELARQQLLEGDRSLILSVAPVGVASPPPDAANVPFVVYLPAARARPRSDLQYLRGVRSVVERLRPQRVHVHGYVFTSLAVPAQIPTVLTVDFHRYVRGSGLAKPVLRSLLARYDAICPVSEYCRRAFNEYWGWSITDRCIVPNGVSLEQFRPLGPAQRLAARSTFGAGASDTLFIYCGRLTPQKGTDVLIEAWRRAGYEEDPTAHLLIAGPPAAQFGGDDVHGFTDLLRERGIRHLGLLDEDALAQLMAAADIFVMPTVEDEMFGMAVVEAMACGAVPVVTDCGALPDVVGEAGFVVAAGDADALAAAMGEAAEGISPRRREVAVSQAARFSWPRVAAGFREVYEGVRR